MQRIKRDFTKWNLLILLLLFLPSTKGCLASSKLAPHLLASRWHQASKVALVSRWCNLHNCSHYTHQWPESTRTFDLLLVLSWIVDVEFRRYLLSRFFLSEGPISTWVSYEGPQWGINLILLNEPEISWGIFFSNCSEIVHILQKWEWDQEDARGHRSFPSLPDKPQCVTDSISLFDLQTNLKVQCLSKHPNMIAASVPPLAQWSCIPHDPRLSRRKVTKHLNLGNHCSLQIPRHQTGLESRIILQAIHYDWSVTPRTEAMFSPLNPSPLPPLSSSFEVFIFCEL